MNRSRVTSADLIRAFQIGRNARIDGKGVAADLTIIMANNFRGYPRMLDLLNEAQKGWRQQDALMNSEADEPHKYELEHLMDKARVR